MMQRFSGLQFLLHVGVPACAVDEFRRIVWWNDYAEQFFSVARTEAVAHEWHTVVRTVHADRCCAVCQARRILMTGARPQPAQVTLAVDEHRRVVTMVPIPVQGTHEGIVAFLIIERRAPGAIELDAPIQISTHRGAPDGAEVLVRLTVRERELLTCIVDGLEARAIGVRLGISHATARNYVQRLLAKLGVHNKAEAVRLAFVHDLLAS